MLEPIVERLRTLGNAIKTSLPHENFMVQQWGWSNPALTGNDLAQMALNLAARIETIRPEVVGPGFDCGPVLQRIDVFQNTSMQYLFNGNGGQAAPTYFALLSWIESQFQGNFPSHVNWERVDEEGLLPKALAARVRGYKASLERLGVELGPLEEKVKYIEQAHDAAVSLPTDLESLRVASEDVRGLRSAAEKDQARAATALEEIERKLSVITEKEEEARKLVENTEDAYSAATTRGLGEAFQIRADGLATSMRIWVAGLLSALLAGAIIGAYRIGKLQELLASTPTNGLISLHLALSLVSVAAPVWFAWIATKQIGQRFRLSEDYAFKASVAKAYEGYRREAARVDPVFASRLFGSALNRIEEAPLRFVENETHGSPLHELLGRRNKSDSSAEASKTP